MTAPTTRERVGGYARFLRGGPLAWWNDIASVAPDWMMTPTRYKPNHVMGPWMPTDSTAAMQPPTETRWVIDRSKGLAAYRSAVREALKAGADIHAQQQAGYRSEFLVNLRDFADGVSDRVLSEAYKAAEVELGSLSFGRTFLRALADQEEGK